MALITFHGNRKLKQEYLDRIKGHYDNNQIVKGHYWRDDTGDAIGCTIHSGNHIQFESLLGIPHIVARKEDRIFEALPDNLYREFPYLFLNSVPVGVSLRLVTYKFFAWFLSGSKYSLSFTAKTEAEKQDIEILSDYLVARIVREPTVQAKADLNKAAINLQTLCKTSEAAMSAHSILTLFKQPAQAWACDKAIQYGQLAYLKANPETEIHEAKGHHGIAMSDKLIELVKSAT